MSVACVIWLYRSFEVEVSNCARFYLNKGERKKKKKKRKKHDTKSRLKMEKNAISFIPLKCENILPFRLQIDEMHRKTNVSNSVMTENVPNQRMSGIPKNFNFSQIPRVMEFLGGGVFDLRGN